MVRSVLAPTLDDRPGQRKEGKRDVAYRPKKMR